MTYKHSWKFNGRSQYFRNMLLKYGLYSFSGSIKITWVCLFKTTHTLGKTPFIAFSLSLSNIDIFRVRFCLVLMGTQNTGQKSDGQNVQVQVPIRLALRMMFAIPAGSVGRCTSYWKYTVENVWECAIVRQFIN